MTSKPNIGLIVGLGALTFLIGLAMIFANIAFGKGIMIASAVGLAVALTRRGPSA